MNRLKDSLPALLNLTAVAEHGSIRKAAEHLNTSQPALTRKLHRVEEVFQLPLLMRTPKGVSLTPFGRMVMQSVQAIEAELFRTIRAAEALKVGASGSFRVGVLPLRAPYALAPAIEKLHDAFPKLSVKIVGGSRAENRARLLSGEIDMVVAVSPFGLPEDGLLSKALFDFHLHVIANAKHPLALRSNITVQDLMRYPWVFPARDSGLYRRYQEEFRRIGGQIPESSWEVAGSTEDTKALLLTSEFLAILPVESVGEEIKQNHLVALNGDWRFGKQTIAAFICKRSANTPVIVSFLSQLKRHGSNQSNRRATEKTKRQRNVPSR